MNIKQIRTFIPGKDFDVSKQFYLDLGLQVVWEGKDLIEFGSSSKKFFLQNFYVEEWANNCMMQLFVDDLESLYKQAESLISKYTGTKIKPIFTADYGKTFHLIDPSGVLWHMTETSKEVEDESKLICEEN